MTTDRETLTYHSVDSLLAMSLEEIQALWDLVPADRRAAYRSTYERTRRDEGAAGSNDREAILIEQLLSGYADRALVPVGAYWVRTPPQIQAAAQTNAPFGPPDTDAVLRPRPQPLLVALGIGAALLVLFLLLRGVGASGGKSARLLTGSRTVTPTLSRTLTPTPLALDAQDAIIRSGNAGSAAASVYPVNLRLSIDTTASPRVFVVQRRAVNTAEWAYDDNPDVASYIAGLTVHPVIGIPWSEANAALFRDAGPGSAIVVQMNTGVTLRFTCTANLNIHRGDTSVFEQRQPGMTLVLMGNPNPEDGDVTDLRAVLLADYAPDALAVPIATLVPTPTPVPTVAERIDVQVISISTQEGRLILHLRVFNGRFTPLTLDDKSASIIFGYSERPAGPPVAAHITPVNLAPGQAADLSLVIAWHSEPFAILSVFDQYSYALKLR